MAAGSLMQEPVPNSTGTEPPKLEAPPGACDCHMHIYDAARFPPARPGSRMQANARVEDYRRLQKRIGTTAHGDRAAGGLRHGQPRHARCHRAARQCPRRGGGASDVSDAELKALHDGGVRGIRFTVFDPATAVTRIDMIEPLSRRVADLGWHVQIHMRGDQIVANADMLRRLPSTDRVRSHGARAAAGRHSSHAAFKIIRELIDKGRTWVKLSGAYQDTKIGPPTYADATALAQAYVKAAPERMVWGSDWPHPTEKDKPNDALLFDLLSQWAPDAATRHRILVDNPASAVRLCRACVSCRG